MNELTFHGVPVVLSDDISGRSPSSQVYLINGDALRWSKREGKPVWEWLWEPKLPPLPREGEEDC